MPTQPSTANSSKQLQSFRAIGIVIALLILLRKGRIRTVQTRFGSDFGMTQTRWSHPSLGMARLFALLNNNRALSLP